MQLLKDVYVKPGSWTLGNKQIAESAKKTNYLHLFEKQQSVNSFDWGYSQEKCHIDWIEPTRIELKLPRRANHTTAEAWLWPDGVPGPKRKSSIIFFVVEKIKLHFNCWTCTENLFHMWVWFEPVPPLQHFLPPTCAKIFHPQRTSSKVKLRHFVVLAALNCVSIELQYFVQGVDFFSRITVESENSPVFFLTENMPEKDQDEINVRRRKFTSKAAHHVTTTCPPDQMLWVCSFILARL